MSSLIIKITQNGSSREYLFNRPGPIIIGSDERCDLHLEDSHLEGKLLEVKVSGGKLFIKELGSRSYIYLNSVILPYREEVSYHESDTISLEGTNYQIQIHQVVEAVEPPPFFENEFKSRLDSMSHELKAKEHGLRKLGHEEEKKQLLLHDLERNYHDFLNEKGLLEIEVNALAARKECLQVALNNTEKDYQAQKDKDFLLHGHIQKLEQEERILKEKILAANQSLTHLKDEREVRNREMNVQRLQINNLESQGLTISTGIADLKAEREHEELALRHEKERLQKVLLESDTAISERKKIETGIRKLLNEKAALDVEVNKVQDQLNGLKDARKAVETGLHELRGNIVREDARSKEIQENIDRLSHEEGQLKALNVELRSELDKAENRLRLKKDEFGQFDHECQDIMRKLTTANFEIERVAHHLKELSGEEEAQKIKVENLKKEIQSLSKRAHDQAREIGRTGDEERHRLSLELKNLEQKLEARMAEFQQLEREVCCLREKHEKEHIAHHSFNLEKNNLESQISKVESVKAIALKEYELLRNEVVRFREDKRRIEKELALLNIKFMDCENRIREREEEARTGIENYKREERAKMLAEKRVLLSEVEAFKQKSLIEVDELMRKRQDEVWRVEEEITAEARNRLKQVTEEADEREVRAHERLKEAQEYFHQKEVEADAIIEKSRLEARGLVKKNETELMEDLLRRKHKIKRFLSMKQEQGLRHLKTLEDQALSRMKKNEAKGHERIEHLKRKELKKIAHLKEEEVLKLQDLKSHAMKEVNVEKEKIRRQIQTMRTQQESELAQTKKKVLEHISQTKFGQQSAWEEELRVQKMQFEQTKKDRIENATQAVLNLLTGEFGYSNGEGVKEKIQDTLSMAINGQNADGLKHVGQILDINPMMRKKMLPVLKKYSLHFGVPAVIAIILLADIGSVRTTIVNYSKDMMTQEKSASDIFVKQQKEAWKEKYSFNPPTTVGYKTTFTDNVLYTTNFEPVMDDEIFQNDWILRVHDFMVKELELSEDVAINYISAEGTVIKELAQLKKEITPQFKDQGIAKLTAAEETHIGWLKEKLSSPEKAQKFAEFRKKFFDDFYSQKYQGPAARNVATELPKSN